MADAQHSRRLFLGCFMALVATAFGFAVRGAVLADWGVQFHLTEEQKGIINGVGLYPFAISIILFSLIVDRIGYGTAMCFGFLGHLVSTLLDDLRPQLRGALCRHLSLRTVQRHGRSGDQPGRGHDLQRQQDPLAQRAARRLAGRTGARRAAVDRRARWPATSLAQSARPDLAMADGRPVDADSVLRLPACSACAFPRRNASRPACPIAKCSREFGWGSAYIVSFLIIMGISQVLTVFEFTADRASKHALL